MWKNVHPVYGVGIRTHNLRNMIPGFPEVSLFVKGGYAFFIKKMHAYLI